MPYETTVDATESEAARQESTKPTDSTVGCVRTAASGTSSRCPTWADFARRYCRYASFSFSLFFVLPRSSSPPPLCVCSESPRDRKLPTLQRKLIIAFYVSLGKRTLIGCRWLSDHFSNSQQQRDCSKSMCIFRLSDSPPELPSFLPHLHLHPDYQPSPPLISSPLLSWPQPPTPTPHLVTVHIIYWSSRLGRPVDFFSARVTCHGLAPRHQAIALEDKLR